MSQKTLLLLFSSSMLIVLACTSPESTTTPDTSAQNDTGQATDTTSSTDTSSPNDTTSTTRPDGFLYTEGNRIYTSDGQIWVGRGANLHDTRSCNACTWGPPNVDEVLRRIDLLVDDWGADFIRLTLESYGSADGRVHYTDVLSNPNYLADVVRIVEHIGTKPDTYVLLSLWIDHSFNDMGWPTDQTREVWKLLAKTFGNDPHVIYGLVNEPEFNFDGSQDAQVWTAMNDTVQAIRDAETAAGVPHHIVAVQGTGGWARFLTYYIDHPITAGSGENVAYEVHVYDPNTEFASRFEIPSQTLPVIIGEYGPSDVGNMTLADCQDLMQRATAHQVPHLAWTFHMRCPPNLLVDHSNGGCGLGMPLEPTEWGRALMQHLATPVP